MRSTLASLIAGMQIALTQPIRIEDAVVVEGEWGWVEEITTTYVVIRIWDLRRQAQAAQQQAQAAQKDSLIAESDLNDVRVLRTRQQGGFGHDAQRNDDFHHAVQALLTGERRVGAFQASTGFVNLIGPTLILSFGPP